MPRKLRKPIKNPDTSNESPEYWTKVLVSWNLASERGRPSRMHMEDGSGGKKLGRRTSFIGSLVNLQTVEEQEFRRKRGKVSPSGSGPE